MFNRNEWLQWAKTAQQSNPEMQDSQFDIRKNNQTRSYLYENNSMEVSENIRKWVTGTHAPIKHEYDVHGNLVPQQHPDVYPDLDPKTEKPHPKAGKPHPKAGKYKRYKASEIWKDRGKIVASRGADLAAQVIAFRPRGGGKEEKPDVGVSHREFETESVEMGGAAPNKPIRPSQVRLALQGEPDLKLKKPQSMKKRLERPRQRVQGLAQSVRYVGTDLQELGAQGWKNVATGAKVVDKISDLAMIGGLIAAPFTGGLSLAATGAGLAAKAGTKVATKVATKTATKMATKQAAKQATKTAGQKAMGVAGQVGTDVATYGAINKLSGGGKPKQDTTAQIQPNKIQQNTGPIAKIGPNNNEKIRQQDNARLAASYIPKGKILNEFAKIFTGATKVKPKPLVSKVKHTTGTQPPITGKGNASVSAGNAAPTTAPKPPETRGAKWKRRGMAAGKTVGGSVATAGAFTLMTPKGPTEPTTAQVQNPTGTARYT